MTFLARVLALSCAAFGIATPALADECGPLQRLSSLDLMPVGNAGRMLVPVSINGVPKKMLLDTAGGITSLNEAAIASLNLQTHDSKVRLLDTTGNASRRYARLDSFQMGNMQGKDIDVMVSPNPNAGENLGSDGVLAGDMMGRYDVEIDFAAHKLNYFSPDHCEGHVVYWPATVIAVVPMTQNRPIREPLGRGRLPSAKDTHIRVPVTLDGKQFMAVINTSAGNSTMSADTAKYVFGITADSPGSVPLGTVNSDPDEKVFGHVFSTLAFDGVTVTNPHIAIRPDLIGAKDPDNNFRTGSRIEHVDDGLGPQVTIGLDVLKHLHLYIAYRDDKLYVTPASPAASQAASAQP